MDFDIKLRNDDLTFPRVFVSSNDRKNAPEEVVFSPETTIKRIATAQHYIYLGDYRTEFWFSIDGTRTITVAPEAKPFLIVDGQTIRFHGHPITMAWSDPSLDARTLNNVGSFADGQQREVRLLPGVYTLTSLDGRAGFLQFWVTLDGNIGYDAALDGVLGGLGTPTLTIRGVRVEIDASLLLPAHDLRLARDPVGDSSFAFYSNEGTFVRTLMPGIYCLRSESQAQSYQPVAYAQFELTHAGKLVVSDHNPTLQATGNRIEVLGTEVDFDASALSYPAYYVQELWGRLGIHEVWDSKGNSGKARVLPGSYGIYAGSEGPEGRPGYVRFLVDRQGLFDYDESLSNTGVLTGRGTKRLGLQGLAITLDATPLYGQTMRLKGVQTKPESTAKKWQFRLLEGTGDHTLLFSDATSIGLKVNAQTGTIEPSSDLWLTVVGWGTRNLIFFGTAVELDLSLFQHFAPDFSLYAYGAREQRLGIFPTATIVSVRLFPGYYSVRVETYNSQSSSSTQKLKGLTLNFQVTNRGPLAQISPPLRPPVLQMEEGIDEHGIKKTKLRIGAQLTSPTPDWPFPKGLPDCVYTATLAVKSDVPPRPAPS